ncbi:outer membrane protein assembly factor BamB family protein [Halogranum rubrum]|nr:PQQ-binding-like beta-propeller repeat protein [Halogranum salarium]
MCPPTRRSFLAASGAVSLSVLALCTRWLYDGRPSADGVPVARPRQRRHLSGESGPWPTLGYDARRSGFRPDTPAFGRDTRIVPTSTAGLVERTPPVVGDGVRLTCADGYVSTSEAELVWRARLVARNTDGRERWRLTGKTGVSTPTVVGQTCFVVLDQQTLAVDCVTGERRWRHDVGSDRPGSAPAVVGERVYVADDRLYALDAVTGDRLWQSDAELEYGVHGLAATKDVVCVTTGDGEHGRLYAFDSDGSRQWDTAQVGENYAPPVVGERHVFVARTESGHIHAVSLADGSIAWTVARGTRGGPVTVADDTVFLTDARESQVVALDTNTGERRWTRAFESSGRGRGLAPRVAGDTVYAVVGTTPSVFTRLDRRSGELQDSFALDFEPLTGPAVGDDAIYVGAASVDGER